ncbi:hypothetical protein AUEXF2481DRAFT_40177 [Aureobasidium subglaciale EXF-2481]|uniref:Uncharacterized protein n=1 Tax=Aureobasidium subglaciale (strain EXF-2481) TaxID=1043005 RepID=A0A074YAY8_AURSE|nr:uncharacterized protein AUEXF2481DRAFT_40177 [Aureobasidium subglaciale EXF-2481]KEQ94940.1 hypothetical protein AUEXF2481DRAFT_40177 [Aureobasidium subglaciale EXF-2481]
MILDRRDDYQHFIRLMQGFLELLGWSTVCMPLVVPTLNPSHTTLHAKDGESSR